MLLPVTLTFAAALALLNFWLAIRCARIRIGSKLLHGDGGNEIMARRMRAHANFTEYAPIVLILFALIEMAIGPSIWLWGTALAYVIARIAHAFGMDASGSTIWRAGGILVNWVVMLGLAASALLIAYQATREMPAPPAMASRG